MVKKVLTLVLGLVLSFGTMAQMSNNVHATKQHAKSVTFPASDIQYWVGSGSNSAVVIIGWDDNPSGNDFALAWGVRWNGSAVAVNMLDTIATYDSRVAYSISSGFVTNIGYNDGTLVSGSDLSYWCYTVNGEYASAYGAQPMANGDVMEISSSCNFSLTTASPATDPNASTDDPVDATIAFEDIHYWVGTGSDSAVLIVNFGIPDTAFAWGYRFNGSATVQDMTDAITAADPRFWVVGQPSYYPNGDIFFITTEGDTLSLSGIDENNPFNYWEANINGGTSYSGAAQELTNGDVFKYGDLRAPSRVCLEEMEYGGAVYCLLSAWTKTPTPVSDPNPNPVIENATIDFSEILYWVGEGENQVVLAVNWADTALAWGYRFSTENVTVEDMMMDIQSADPRFGYTMNGSYLGDITFVISDGDTLRGTSWWESKLNGSTDMGMSQLLSNGDFEKWADPAAGVIVDSMEYNGYWYYTYAYPMTIHPVSVPANPMPQVEEATIDFAEILYWVGEGSKRAVLAVNWADTALAWGYKFDGTKTVADMMTDIAAADPRFSYVGEGFVSDILFNDGTVSLAGTPGNYWGSSNNGIVDMGLSEVLDDGDLEKWGDPAAGVIVDSMEWEGYWYYTYAYPMTIHPVSIPQIEGIDNTEAVNISVYPNPVANVVTVSGINGNGMIYDMRGSVVSTFTVNGETRLDLSRLSNGIYMLRVADSIVKIVKE